MYATRGRVCTQHFIQKRQSCIRFLVLHHNVNPLYSMIKLWHEACSSRSVDFTVFVKDTTTMKRTLVLILFCTIALFCIPGAAQATPTTFTLTSAGHIVDHNYYVGPYTASITGGSTLQIICDNFNTNVHIGLTWTAVANTFSDPTFLSKVKLAGVSTTGKSALQNYEAAAWLAEQILANLSNATKVGDLQFALWAIFSSQAKGSAGFTAGAAADYQTAINGVYTTNQFSNVTFWTPNPLYASQEYITVTPVPEPSSVLLFGIGLLTLGVTLRRKLRSQLA